MVFRHGRAEKLIILIIQTQLANTLTRQLDGVLCAAYNLLLYQGSFVIIESPIERPANAIRDSSFEL